jgi:hypothetical protein
MDLKKNDFILVRRVAPCFEDLDIEEFTETVRGHRNGGYQLRGEIQIVIGAQEAVVAQVLVAPIILNGNVL